MALRGHVDQLAHYAAKILLVDQLAQYLVKLRSADQLSQYLAKFVLVDQLENIWQSKGWLISWCNIQPSYS